MIEADLAGESARQALRSADGDPLLAGWRGLSAAEPLMVSDVAGTPAYWVVPILSGGHAVGFVRVTGDGSVAAIGLTCRTPETPAACPVPVAAMSSAAVRASLALEPGEAAGPSRLVHDGPPGREAWLTQTTRGGAIYRWIFTGPGGSNARPAGTAHDSGAEVE